MVSYDHGAHVLIYKALHNDQTAKVLIYKALHDSYDNN